MFETEKIPNKNDMFLAEVILTAGKQQITIDEVINEMKDILNAKEK